MGVFPGGKSVAAGDAGGEVDANNSESAGRAAGVGETEEEAGSTVASEEYVCLSQWTPPPGQRKRFATWFFVAKVQGAMDVAIDDGEIKDE